MSAALLTRGALFADYIDQPDTAKRTRLAVQAIPFALPERPVTRQDEHARAGRINQKSQALGADQ